MKQKFHVGDRVRIDKEMPACMSHFPHDVEALVLHSYYDMHLIDPYKYGGDENGKKEYAVYILPDRGFCAWYMEDQLTRVKRGER